MVVNGKNFLLKSIICMIYTDFFYDKVNDMIINT